MPPPSPHPHPHPHPHAPEGAPNNHSPSAHVANLLDALCHFFRDATQHGFCPVAAAAYAAHASQHQSNHRPHPPSPHHFNMRTHVGDPPLGRLLCSCVTLANNPPTSTHQSVRALTPCHSPNPNITVRTTKEPCVSHRYRRTRHQPQFRENLNRDQCDQQAGASSSETLVENKSASRIADLRKEMQNLDDASKMALVRDRMMSPYKRSKTLELENNVRRLFEDQYKRMSRSGAVLPPDAEPTNGDDMLGCVHYARRCKLKAKCCGLFVTCRFCHDEAMAEDHEMDRFATEKVLCMNCLTEQDVTRNCIKCGTEFAHHFCEECRFYENTPGKKVYHCGRCHICRLGEGLDIDNYHCDNCDACVSLPSKPYHRCMSKALHSNCPVCRGYLFTSTEPVIFMRCGHTMHSKCFDDYTAESYQCPLCLRSLTDMEKYFDQIDEIMRLEPMPEEYRHKRSVIFCRDCQSKSTVKYHYVYHKCTNPKCRSYNTRVVDVFDEDGSDERKNGNRGRQEQERSIGEFGDSRRVEGGAASVSTSALRVGDRTGSSEFYSSDRRGSYSPLHVENDEERTPTEEGQVTQPPIESTV